MDETLQALLDVGWYNGYEENIKQIITYIKNCSKKSTHNILFPEFLREIDCDDYIRVFWSVLVVLYGDYGTSPRFGWLDSEEVSDIIEDIDRYMGE